MRGKGGLETQFSLNFLSETTPVFNNSVTMKVIILSALVAVAMAAKLGTLSNLHSTYIVPPHHLPTAIQHTPPLITTPPKPYSFGFEVRDDNTTNYHNRAEAAGDGCVRGSYSYVLPDGFVYTYKYQDCGQGYEIVEQRKEPSGIQVIIPEPKPKIAKEQSLFTAA
ncbi:cuticular protein RR-2 motif 78 precursor [Penaeus vannamei]|uniref:Cuticular protein RR-2 motif 78 n=1 Tax=Penaeus vannamei TaxID=6689 RepID=A0A423U9I6_PENVA|nr:cuticular protein RR-2 motif 78 precursor [Penaeus vannamei]